MAKNEAKIKFTAETSEFNDSIKKANSEMSELRAELKLNEAQMQNTGASVELLEKKHSLLESQLKASQSKTDALNAKIKKAAQIFGEDSDEVTKLKTQLANAQTQEEKLKTALKKCNKEIEDQTESSKDAGNALEDMGDAARNTEEGFTVAKGAVADLASNAIQAAIGKVKEFIDYLMELPEATREIRQDMATLETSFETQGFSTKAATDTWKELYKVFGEDDRAVEASNLISKMSDNQKDLNDWVTITKGVWGQYQDSLPVEGLAEASNETAKTGKVTGVLADALNWSGEAAGMFSKYMSEDVTTAEDAFNEALADCSTEAERQALITETLTKLYGDSAKKYEEASGAQIAAKDATAENILVQNELADTMEPLTTSWQGMKNEMLTGLLPAVQKFSEWGVSAIAWLKEHPVVMKVLAGVLGVLAGVFAALTVVTIAQTVAQWAQNAAWLACPITWIIIGIVAAIAALVAIFSILWTECDGFRQFFIDAWEQIKVVWDQVKPYFEVLWDWIKTYASIVWDFIVMRVKLAWEAIKLVWSVAVDYFKTIWENIKLVFSVVKKVLSGDFRGAWEDIKKIWSNCSGFFDRTIGKVKSTFSKVTSIIAEPFKKAIDKVKGFFDRLKLKFPSIKLPHFKITGEFSLNPPSVPKFGVEWYAKGGIFTKPTIFNTPYGWKGVGEAGAEAVLPIDRLQGYIAGAIEKSTQTVNLQSLADAIEDLANRPIAMNINGKQFALATAGDTDSVSGMRSRFVDRGMILE